MTSVIMTASQSTPAICAVRSPPVIRPDTVTVGPNQVFSSG